MDPRVGLNTNDEEKTFCLARNLNSDVQSVYSKFTVHILLKLLLGYFCPKENQ